MSIQKQMNRFIPFPIKLLKSMTIPPILIKLPMIQFTQLSKEITHKLKHNIKCQHEKYCTR